MIKAVIFDMDGVLADSEYAYLVRITNFLQAEGYDIDFSQVCPVAGLDDHTLWVRLGEVLHTSFTLEERKQSLETYIKNHPIIYPELLNEGVETILRKLKNDGYKIALASSSRMAHIQEMLTSCHLTSYFEHVLSGEMFLKTKPDPAIYRKAIELLACDPGEIIVIEDSKYGIKAAKGANLYTMAKRETRFFVDQTQADIVFTTFAEAYECITQKNNENGCK